MVQEISFESTVTAQPDAAYSIPLGPYVTFSRKSRPVTGDFWSVFASRGLGPKLIPAICDRQHMREEGGEEEGGEREGEREGKKET